MADAPTQIDTDADQQQETKKRKVREFNTNFMHYLTDMLHRLRSWKVPKRRG